MAPAYFRQGLVYRFAPLRLDPRSAAEAFGQGLEQFLGLAQPQAGGELQRLRLGLCELVAGEHGVARVEAFQYRSSLCSDRCAFVLGHECSQFLPHERVAPQRRVDARLDTDEAKRGVVVRVVDRGIRRRRPFGRTRVALIHIDVGRSDWGRNNGRSDGSNNGTERRHGRRRLLTVAVLAACKHE